MSYEKNARVINDDIFDLINSCFEKERNSRSKSAKVRIFERLDKNT